MFILTSSDTSSLTLVVRLTILTERYMSLAASLVNFIDDVKTSGKVEVPAVKLLKSSGKISHSLTALIPAGKPQGQLGHNLGGVAQLRLDPLHEVSLSPPQTVIVDLLRVLLHIFRGRNRLDRDWNTLLLVLRADLEEIYYLLLLLKSLEYLPCWRACARNWFWPLSCSVDATPF